MAGVQIWRESCSLRPFQMLANRHICVAKGFLKSTQGTPKNYSRQIGFRSPCSRAPRAFSSDSLSAPTAPPFPPARASSRPLAVFSFVRTEGSYPLQFASHSKVEITKKKLRGDFGSIHIIYQHSPFVPAMVGQQGINYAVCLISTHFGDVVAKVCECLIRHGSLSFLEVVRFTELPQGQVKNSLLVLIQHNCVQAFSVPKTVGMGGITKPITLYMIIFDNIIHRMRFSKFCLIVKEHLGHQCAEFLEGFLQHGRLTFELLFDRASGLTEGKATRNDVLAKFNKLVHAQYVERCPKGEPFLEPKSDEEVSSIRKRIKSSGETRTIEQEAIIAAAPLDADRFSGIISLTMNTEEDMKEVGNTLETSAGNKRKHEVLEADEDIQNAINTTEVLWRVNYEKFVHCLKKKACVANVRSRLGLDAAIVLEAMIDANDHQNIAMNSVTLSMNSIIEGVRGKPGGISLTLERVRAILEQLGSQLCPEESGTLYTIGLKGIIETCQNDEVESLVLNKYGKEAYRIFRMLILAGRLIAMDQISDNTFLEKKEAQKILCKLWKDDYVEMEKVNLNAGVRAEVFLWKVNKKFLWEHVLNDIFHTALNISKKISQVTEECQVSKTDEEKDKKLKRARRILESALLKMDDAIMLFHDF